VLAQLLVLEDLLRESGAGSARASLPADGQTAERSPADGQTVEVSPADGQTAERSPADGQAPAASRASSARAKGLRFQARRQTDTLAGARPAPHVVGTVRRPQTLRLADSLVEQSARRGGRRLQLDLLLPDELGSGIITQVGGPGRTDG
jgi:hypothetical protein